ncbi:hypothetical protein, partial [Pseudomonas viridiflava]|uniref:hypothetical protein n=1 Tax=Pseudomonas viridiflava TaxID=33069 RepID=UPI00197DEE9C
YRIERDQVGDNPDQHIADDISTLVELTISLTIRFVTTMVSLASFGYLTWTKGGDLIPRFSVWRCTCRATCFGWL